MTYVLPRLKLNFLGLKQQGSVRLCNLRREIELESTHVEILKTNYQFLWWWCSTTRMMMTKSVARNS